MNGSDGYFLQVAAALLSPYGQVVADADDPGGVEAGGERAGVEVVHQRADHEDPVRALDEGETPPMAEKLHENIASLHNT
ncbi:hypothetical protein P8A22_23155 [Streptomyces laculatispora]|uniref:Uncharacterized protein n=1 Tax=Streptomyces laculatispora TaxID=887464 RepID=A0ABY9I6T9_9ACTN|nr:hypothetical protein [Streptomyces laculatispora]WLQ42585.1 hypothetical protein P8A22_23155 [Streptomyces laculatispora]